MNILGEREGEREGKGEIVVTVERGKESRNIKRKINEFSIEKKKREYINFTCEEALIECICNYKREEYWKEVEKKSKEQFYKETHNLKYFEWNDDSSENSYLTILSKNNPIEQDSFSCCAISYLYKYILESCFFYFEKCLTYEEQKLTQPYDKEITLFHSLKYRNKYTQKDIKRRKRLARSIKGDITCNQRNEERGKQHILLSFGVAYQPLQNELLEYYIPKGNDTKNIRFDSHLKNRKNSKYNLDLNDLYVADRKSIKKADKMKRKNIVQKKSERKKKRRKKQIKGSKEKILKCRKSEETRNGKNKNSKEKLQPFGCTNNNHFSTDEEKNDISFSKFIPKKKKEKFSGNKEHDIEYVFKEIMDLCQNKTLFRMRKKKKKKKKKEKNMNGKGEINKKENNFQDIKIMQGKHSIKEFSPQKGIPDHFQVQRKIHIPMISQAIHRNFSESHSIYLNKCMKNQQLKNMHRMNFNQQPKQMFPVEPNEKRENAAMIQRKRSFSLCSIDNEHVEENIKKKVNTLKDRIIDPMKQFPLYHRRQHEMQKMQLKREAGGSQQTNERIPQMTRGTTLETKRNTQVEVGNMEQKEMIEERNKKIKRKKGNKKPFKAPKRSQEIKRIDQLNLFQTVFQIGKGKRKLLQILLCRGLKHKYYNPKIMMTKPMKSKKKKRKFEFQGKQTIQKKNQRTNLHKNKTKLYDKKEKNPKKRLLVLSTIELLKFQFTSLFMSQEYETIISLYKYKYIHIEFYLTFLYMKSLIKLQRYEECLNYVLDINENNQQLESKKSILYYITGKCYEKLRNLKWSKKEYSKGIVYPLNKKKEEKSKNKNETNQVQQEIHDINLKEHIEIIPFIFSCLDKLIATYQLKPHEEKMLVQYAEINYNLNRFVYHYFSKINRFNYKFYDFQISKVNKTSLNEDQATNKEFLRKVNLSKQTGIRRKYKERNLNNREMNLTNMKGKPKTMSAFPVITQINLKSTKYKSRFLYRLQEFEYTQYLDSRQLLKKKNSKGRRSTSCTTEYKKRMIHYIDEKIWTHRKGYNVNNKKESKRKRKRTKRKKKLCKVKRSYHWEIEKKKR